jgi:hypothetical protein
LAGAAVRALGVGGACVSAALLQQTTCILHGTAAAVRVRTRLQLAQRGACGHCGQQALARECLAHLIVMASQRVEVTRVWQRVHDGPQASVAEMAGLDVQKA